MIKYAWKRFLKIFYMPTSLFAGMIISDIIRNKVSIEGTLTALFVALLFGLFFLFWVSIAEYLYYAYLAHKANKLGGEVAVNDIYDARYLIGWNVDYIAELGEKFDIYFKAEMKSGGYRD
jgi:hypothetical protein